MKQSRNGGPFILTRMIAPACAVLLAAGAPRRAVAADPADARFQGPAAPDLAVTMVYVPEGSHGEGSPQAPKNWADSPLGEVYYNGAYRNSPGYGHVGTWVFPDEIDRVRHRWRAMDAERTGRYGARVVRTAPSRALRDSALQMDLLPKRQGCDIGKR